MCIISDNELVLFEYIRASISRLLREIALQILLSAYCYGTSYVVLIVIVQYIVVLGTST